MITLTILIKLNKWVWSKVHVFIINCQKVIVKQDIYNVIYVLFFNSVR